jgi:predicted DNA-binding protein
VSVHKVRFFVIPAEAGIQNLLKTLDSGLRTAGMTESKSWFMDGLETNVHRTQIYLTKEQYQYLQRQAEKKKASIAEIVRELINERLPKDKDYEDNPLFSIAKDGFSMGRHKGSIKHDEYIYRKRK